MSFDVIAPPKTDEEIYEASKEILEAAEAFGMNMNVEGFLMSWLSGTRVVVERDDKGGIVALCIFTAGERWNYPDNAAHVLRLDGVSTEGILDFVKMLCKAMGVQTLFVPSKEIEIVSEELERHHVDAWRLQ